MSFPKLFDGDLTIEKWRNRRSEIASLLECYEYGKTPEVDLDSVGYSMPQKMALASGIIYEEYRVYFIKDFESCSLHFDVYYRDSDKPLPAILQVDPFEQNGFNAAKSLSEITNEKFYGRFPYEMIVDAGYAAILIHVDDICPDSKTNYQNGIMKFSQNDPLNGWGAIGVWAWGVSRVVDFLLEDPRFDSNKITVQGISRAGKAALWCGAQDERIAAVISTVSGCGGASLLRNEKGEPKKGEHIADMSRNFGYWTCGRYAEFAGKEEDFPVDQQMLLAMIAPRPLYISDAIEDEWADPQKSFEAAQMVEKIYTLYGLKGLSADKYPDVHCPCMDGDVAYHVRTGGHGCIPYDWEQYLKFLNKYFS